MKKAPLSILLTTLAVGSVGIAKDVDLVFNKPESAYVDTASKAIYVSNIVGEGNVVDGNGYITKLDLEGNVIKEKWIEGLDAPKGLRAFGNTLAVADISKVVLIDIAKGERIGDPIAVNGAQFLNDVAWDSNGNIYVSDTVGSAIHRLTLYSNSAISEVFAQGPELEYPNGLLVVEDGKQSDLIVAAWGAVPFGSDPKGNLYAIDLKTKERKKISQEPIGNLDGLEYLPAERTFLVSAWVEGKVFKVPTTGALSGVPSLVGEGFSGAADIGLDPAGKFYVVPRMQENKVSILPLQ